MLSFSVRKQMKILSSCMCRSFRITDTSLCKLFLSVSLNLCLCTRSSKTSPEIFLHNSLGRQKGEEKLILEVKSNCKLGKLKPG